MHCHEFSCIFGEPQFKNRFKVIRKIFQYVGIGLLIGVGIVVTEAVYYAFFWEDRMSAVEERFEETFENIFNQFYQPGYVSFWDRLEQEQPEALMTFSLERARFSESSVQITGVIENVGPVVWSSLVVEVEAIDANGRVFAECNELIRTVEPGSKETIVSICPFIEGVVDADLSEVSFRVIRGFPERRVVPPNESLEP